MSIPVSANQLSVVHKGSGGFSVAFPDVCKTPSGGAPIPIPYPSIARIATTKQQTAGGATAVKSPVVPQSSGTQPPSAGGVVSSRIQGKTEYMLYSFDVKYEGKNVTRLGDPLFHNQHNTPAATVQSESAQLRNMLNDLHFQLQHLPAGSPERWQKVLEDYSVAASALYRTISSD